MMSTESAPARAFSRLHGAWCFVIALPCRGPARRARNAAPLMCAAAPESSAGPASPARYMPKVERGDPIVDAAHAVLGASAVKSFELLDTRWNGNEVFRYDLEGCARRTAFVKMNRVEDPTVFMSEAVGLTTLAAAADSVTVPKPLHIGKLPRVGEYGPGAFMILDWHQLVPFGASRPEAQRKLADVLADIHTSTAFENIHKGRFGFSTNNFLALTPMDNSWIADWPKFFAKRFVAQVNAAYKHKPYGRAPLDPENENDVSLKPLARRIVSGMDAFFEDCRVTPSLLHGDLWIGNVGATADSKPVVFDPACFFGHSELDLALSRMFGGFTDVFWDTYFARVPKQPGFETRVVLYELLQYLNQLNLFGDPAVKEKVFSYSKQLVAFLDAKGH